MSIYSEEQFWSKVPTLWQRVWLKLDTALMFVGLSAKHQFQVFRHLGIAVGFFGYGIGIVLYSLYWRVRRGLGFGGQRRWPKEVLVGGIPISFVSPNVSDSQHEVSGSLDC